MGVGRAIFASAGKISQHLIPGGYSRIDTPRGQAGPVSANRGAILGVCSGGKPGDLLWFTNINDAINTLRSGALLDALRFALNPGGELVPQMVGAMRVNPATQAVSTIQDTVPADIIDIKSKDYGIYTNNIKFTIANATTKGKKLTVTLNAESQILDDIYKDSIKIQYTGDATTGVMTITGTQLTTTLAGDQTDGSLNLTVAFATYITIEQVVGYINSQTGYTCSLIDGVDEEDAPGEMDAYSAQNIKAAEITVTSNVEALIDRINGESNYLSDAALHAAASRATIVNVANRYLTGAIEGTADSTAYTAKLVLLEQEDVQVFGATDDTYAIQALFKTHEVAMNAVTGKKERQVILGATLASTLANAITEAKVKNSAGAGFCFGEFKDYDLNGVEQSYGSVYYAAKMIGQFCALDIIQPHTFKEFSATELLTKLTTTEKEQAIEAGLWVPEISPQGTFRTVRSVTTYQKDNLVKNEFSMWRTALYVSRDLRNYLETTFVGQAGDTAVLASIETLSTVKLNDYRASNYFVDNPNDDWGGESWKSMVIAIDGDAISLNYDATITSPINFLFLVNKFNILVTL